MLSVICPIYNEVKYIDVCIQSVLLQDYPKEQLEVLFVDGMSRDGTRERVLEYAREYPFIKLIDNPKKIVPVAMNIGIRASKGDVVMRLDAHASYPTNYFGVLVKKLYELNADNVGAACRTDVLNKTPKTLAIREVLSNRFGVGNSTFRLGVDKVMDVETVPFGCWRRKVFEKYGYYDERLIRNQDIELNKRIIHGGGRICIVPETYCTYLARETFKGLFLLSLLLPLFAALFYLPFAFLSFLSLLSYLLVLFCISMSINLRSKISISYLLLSFVVLHLSYGYGSLVGIYKCIGYGK